MCHYPIGVMALYMAASGIAHGFKNIAKTNNISELFNLTDASVER